MRARNRRLSARPAGFLPPALNVEFANEIYSAIRGWIETALNWYYISAVTVMLFVCFYLMCGRFGNIRLGDDDSRPEFSNFSWFAMLFSAGVGIGLLFFGIAEPIFYFDNAAAWGYPNNPFADHNGVAEMTTDRAVAAMRVTYFHWGFHGWAVYVMVGLCLAYFGFRKKLPLTLRSALYPVIGDRIYGPIGHAVDLLAVFGTVFGVATSLGLGVSQMATGLNHLFGYRPWPDDHQVILIGLITIVATLSAVSGVGNGIRIISEWNIYLQHRAAGVLPVRRADQMAAGLFRDLDWRLPVECHSHGLPDLQRCRRREVARQLDHLLLGLVDILGTVRGHVHRPDQPRTHHSRVHGRRHVCADDHRVLLALHLWRQRHLYGAEARAVVGHSRCRTRPAWNLPGALWHHRADDAIMGPAMGWRALATFLLATWFITSSDSGTLVITTMLSMGDDNPPKRFRIIWGLGEGFVAAVLLMSGGLKALQTASIAAALPVSVIMLLMTYGILKSLNEDSSAVPASGATVAPDGTSLKGELRT